MRTQSRDTHPEAERVLIELIRKAPMSKRFRLLRSMTAVAAKLNQQNIRQLHPDFAKEEIAATFATDHYDRKLVQGIQSILKQRKTSLTSDLLDTLSSMVKIFELLHVRYYVEGTMALSLYGMQRAAFNIDFVADLQPDLSDNVIKLLKTTCYIDEGAVKNALLTQTGFEGIHLESMLKISVSLIPNTPFDQTIYRRLQKYIVAENCPTINLASAEDIILAQLQEYKTGGEVADDQWNDMLGVLKVQGEMLDLAYLEQWADTLDLSHLLASACFDAGLKRG